MKISLAMCSTGKQATTIGKLSLSLCFTLMMIIGLSMAKVDQAWAGGEINMLTKGGCKADNKTDNMPMINKALQAGYSILYFPKGTYLFAGQINLVKQSILGDGMGKTVLHQQIAILPPGKNGVLSAVINTSGTCTVSGVTLESEQTDLANEGMGQLVVGINAFNNTIALKGVQFEHYVANPSVTDELTYGLYLNNATNVTISGCDFESGLFGEVYVVGGKNITVSGSILNGGTAIVITPAQAGGTVAGVHILSNSINGQVLGSALVDSTINSNRFGVNGLLQVVGDTFDNARVNYPTTIGYSGPVNTLQIANNLFNSSALSANGSIGVLWLGAVSGGVPAVQNVQVIGNTLVAPASDLKDLYLLYHNLTTGSGIAVTGVDLYLGTGLDSVPTGASRGVKNIVIEGNKISNMISHGIVLDFNGNVAVSKNPLIENCRAEGICVGPNTTGTIEIAFNTILNTGFEASMPAKQLNYAVVDVQAIGIGKFTGNKDSTTLPNSIASALKAGHTTQVVPTVVDNVYKGPANHNLFGYRNTP